MTSFNVLPNELKTRIFEFLQLGRHNPSSSPWYKHHVYECRDALVALCLVSRDVYNLAMPVLYASVYRTKPSGAAEYYLTKADLQTSIAPFKNTRSVAVDATGMGNIADTLWIAGFRTKLRKLVIVRSPWTLEQIMCQLSIAFKDLSALEVWVNTALVGERIPSPVQDKAPLPLQKLEQLTAPITELSHLYHAYHVDVPHLTIHYASHSPKQSLWGMEGGPSEFFAKEELPIASLTLTARWTPSFAVLPAALEILCLTGHPLTKALQQTIKALPNLQVLEISSGGDLSFLRQLPGDLTHFFYHVDTLNEVSESLHEIARSDGLAGWAEFYIMIVLNLEAFDDIGPAHCRAYVEAIQQATEELQSYNEKIYIDVFDILQHSVLFEKQWPYPLGTFDHTGRRLLLPKTEQEVQYAVDRLCKFARRSSGLLQYMQTRYYNGSLGERLADDLEVEDRVGEHLVQVLEAGEYIMRTDNGWLAAVSDGDSTARYQTSWVPTPKLFSEYYAMLGTIALE